MAHAHPLTLVPEPAPDPLDVALDFEPDPSVESWRRTFEDHVSDALALVEEVRS